MLRPVILTPSAEENTGIRKLFMNRAYAEAIEHAGGIFISTGRPRDEEDVAAILNVANGLFLMGGHDICPEFYHEENRHCTGIHRERDELEMMLLKKALERRLPVLGICRGLQVMNVAFGGSLYQDVLKEMPGAVKHDYHKDDAGNELPRDTLAHEISIEPNTLLRTILGKDVMKVNSLHHQGVNMLGRGLSATAHSEDGLVEAVEIAGYPFGLGIEWHPEELGDEVSQKIFAAFIEAAKKTGGTSEKMADVPIPLEAVKQN